MNNQIFEIYFAFTIVYCQGLDTLVKEKMVQTVTNGIKLWNCLDCGYGSAKTTNITKHIERMHMNVTLTCDFCQRLFKSRNDLNVHMKSHSELAFTT